MFSGSIGFGGILLSKFLLILILMATSLPAASVSPGGYTNAFSSQPLTADWATLSLAGGGADSYDPDAQMNVSVTTGGTTSPASPDSGNPPAASATAVWSSTGLYLQTRPTANRATVLMGKFVNNTGTNATQISVSYLMSIGTGADEDPGKGTRFYFSHTGGASSWTNAPALNSTTSTSGTSLRSATLSVNWTNGGNLFLAWLDDNGTAGTDSANQYDNFSLRVTAGTPTNFFCFVTHPGNGATVPSNFSIVSTAITGGSLPPYSIEYFTNNGASNTAFASVGTASAPPYFVNLGSLSAGTHRIYAVSTDSSGAFSVTSPTNTFAVADPVVLTLNLPQDGAVFAHTNSVAATATITGGTPPYSVQFYLDDIPRGAPSTSPPFARDLGPLPVGEHRIQAIANDGVGWTAISLISTVRIDGPLAVTLAPAHNAVVPSGANVSLSASVAGGTAPYRATFFLNGQPAGSLTAPPFTLDLGSLAVGSYTCYVHATDQSVPAQALYSTTNRFAVVPPPLRIMPMGDSITLGIPIAGGYRAPLYHLLTNSGQSVDFIGTQSANTASTLPDPHHEGYSGFTIRGIDSLLPGIFSAVAPPDIILLLIGVNDFRGGDDITHATNRLEELVARMATNWPGARILVGSLTPVSEPLETQIQTNFNVLLPGLCERQRSLGRQVFFVDMHAAVPLADMPDQLHPNQLGYNKMATNWFIAMNQLPCAGCPPRFVTHPRSQSMLPGTNVTLSAGAVGSAGPIQYQWRLDGQMIQDATNAFYAFTNASIQHQGNYSVVATDTNGSATSSNAFLHLFIRPVIILNPLPQNVLQGGIARFTAMATGAPPIWYRWLSNSVGIFTNNTGVLVLTNVQSGFTLRVTATNFASGPVGIIGNGVALTVLADFDRDGMADRWETNYPGFATNSAADSLLDFDGDRMINRDEYAAATDPTNPESLLQVTFGVTNSALLEFVAISNISYSVQFRTNLSSGSWTSVTNLNAQSQTRTVQVNAVSTPRPEGFYRIVTPAETD